MPRGHLEGLALDLRYIHRYCFRNVLYLLCMKYDTLSHMGPVRNDQPNPLNSIQESSETQKYGQFVGNPDRKAEAE